MKFVFCLVVALCLIAVGVSAVANEKPTHGSIEGTITDQSNGEPLIGATIYLADRFGGAIADENGHFIIRNLEPGFYSLRISSIGHEIKQIDSIEVVAGQTATITTSLNLKLHELRGITVTPGRFSIMGTEATATQTLTRRELETTPQTGEDMFRAVARLPGVAAEDMSSRFIVRGGEYEEVLVNLNGLQLYEPFHLKDFLGGLFSAIDASAVEGVELITGGFTAQYGDRMSGVFNIKTHRPPIGEKKVSAGVSFMNARFMTEGTFAQNRGSWLLSGRRGYLDVLLKIAGEGQNFKPTYYDFLGKLQYQLNNKHIFSAHFLHAGDRFRSVDDENGDADTIVTSYDNSYFWFNLQSQLSDRLTGHSLLSVGQVKHRRWGQDYWAGQQLVEGYADDRQSFTVLGFKSDWELELSKRYILKAGIDARKLSADYDYLLLDPIYIWQRDTVQQIWELIHLRTDTTLAKLEPSGSQIGAYLSHRFQLAEPLTVEIGGRYDRHSYTGDENYSPRLNAAYQLGENTSLRGGWGIYYQAQRIDELSPGDHIVGFLPSEKAEHRTLGLEHDFGTGVKLRLEAYHKEYSDLRPDLRNTHDRLTGFPEYESDRTVVYRDGATAKGLEFFLKREKGSKFTWLLSYAYAKVEDNVDRIRFKNIDDPAGQEISYNRTFPNLFDQRHTFYLDMSYRPNYKWQFNLAWNIHSGWPYTGVELRSAEVDGETVYWINSTERLAQRFPYYSRVDIRLNRYFDVWGGRMTAFIEIVNLLGKENVRGYDYSTYLYNNQLRLRRDVQANFGTLPILGVVYSLNM